MEAALSLNYDTRLVLSWACAALLGLGLRLLGKFPGRRAAGIALMTVPLWLTLWAYVNTIQRLADGGSVLPTYSTWILSSLWTRSTLIDLGYTGAGFLLYAWGQGPLTVQSLARTAARAGLPMGQRSEGKSILVGLLAFPVFLFATALVNWLVYSQSAFVNGDETSVWDAMTPYHTIFLSLSAGLGEELVYRGVLLVGLLHLLPKNRWGVAAAVVLQALVFGFAHAGYGTWAHVIVPTLFGLFAGAVAMRFGIWAAIVFHVLVDIYAFGSDAAANAPWFGVLLAVALLANAMFSGVVSIRWTYRRFVQAPTP